MSTIAEEARAGQHQYGHHEGRHCHTVDVYVDTRRFVLQPGPYEVATFKKVCGIPLADDLDQLVNRKLKPIADDATIDIEGCEIFISHVKDGGSS
jgi:hypothetical protein